MDKKNLIAFLALSLAVLMLSNLLFPPPKRPAPKAGNQAGAAADAGAKAGGEEKVAAAPAEKPRGEKPACGESAAC